ncbi:MAG: J domain-containing protein [Woeseiaceae bacterium]|nr:J domain-containing protein [Woeseiaceae bacterium]
MSYANEQEPDYYELFGVERDAPLIAIRRSYRRLMQQAGNHPDRGGDTRTAALINRAYAVLKDIDQRRLYDARLDILSRIAMGIDAEPERQPDPEPIDPRSTCLFCEQPHDHILDGMADPGCGNCGSPLRVVDRTRLDPDDNRAVCRLGRKLNVHVFAHSQQEKGAAARSVDISPHGVQLTTRMELRPGQRIRVKGQVLDAVGVVTHCARRNEGWRNLTVAGVSFLTLRILRPVGAFVSQTV